MQRRNPATSLLVAWLLVHPEVAHHHSSQLLQQQQGSYKLASVANSPKRYTVAEKQQSHSMRYPRWTLSTVLTVSAATARFSSAFSPSTMTRGRPTMRIPSTQHRRTTTTTSVLHANVRRLSDPQRELLDQVDIFIFDCDGVIWRVSCVACWSVCECVVLACCAVYDCVATVRAMVAGAEASEKASEQANALASHRRIHNQPHHTHTFSTTQ